MREGERVDFVPKKVAQFIGACISNRYTQKMHIPVAVQTGQNNSASFKLGFSDEIISVIYASVVVPLPVVVRNSKR